MTQQAINYSPVAFNNIVPVLDIGDPSQEFLESMSGVEAALRAEGEQIQRDSKVIQANVAQRNADVQGLISLTQKGAKLYGEEKNRQLKSRLSEIWAENFNKDPDTDQDWAAEASKYSTPAQEESKESTDIDVTLGNNLQKKTEVTSRDTAAAAKIRQATGLEGMVAANARTAAAAESYQSAYRVWMQRVNPDPGADTVAARNEFNKRWSEMTGLNAANPSFLAAQVYPRLRREGAAIEEQQRRTWTASKDAEKRDQYAMRVATGEMTLDEAFTAIKGTTKSDGVTLYNNEDSWSWLTSLKLPTETLGQFADLPFPTGGTWGKHPRFQALLTDARNRKRQEDKARRLEASRRLSLEYTINMTAAERLALRDRQLQENPPDLQNEIFQAYSNAEARGAEQESNRLNQSKYDTFIQNRPAGSLPTMAEWTRAGGDAAWATKNSRFFADDVKQESIEQQIKDSQQYKDLRGDIPRYLKSLSPQIKIVPANTAGGAINNDAFITRAQNDIVDIATGLMLSGKVDNWETAYQAAVEKWQQGIAKLQAEGKLYDKDSNKLYEPSINGGISDDALNQSRLIQNATINNVGTGLLDIDYEHPANGQYSERVKTTGKLLGKTPQQIVNMARQQKGMPAMDPDPYTTSLGRVNPRTLARIASLDNNSSHAALRAQISSGERLGGTPQERTVAVGQMLDALGVTNLWQHKDFNWGYTGSGTEAIGTHVQGSAHYDDRAIDIGQVGNEGRMNMIFAYLWKNKERLGIQQLIYKDKFYGTGGPVAGHDAHIHVGF